jgi:hypothetical protein
MLVSFKLNCGLLRERNPKRTKGVELTSLSSLEYLQPLRFIIKYMRKYAELRYRRLYLPKFPVRFGMLAEEGF